MSELIDKQETLKNMCEACGYCEMFGKAMRSTHPDFVPGKCNTYKFLAEQPIIESDLIDKDAILRLCNEIEGIVHEIYNTGHMMQNCDYDAILNRVKKLKKGMTEDAGTY